MTHLLYASTLCQVKKIVKQYQFCPNDLDLFDQGQPKNNRVLALGMFDQCAKFE
jgi:hypothetical protein